LKKDKTYRIIISGGGTGGHIYPALSIAQALKEKYHDIEILFVGAFGKMEMQKVPEAGYPIRGIWISGIQRKSIWKNVIFPFKLAISLLQANRMLNSVTPDLAIGVGGFASGPLLWIASKKRIPTLIQEQNSYAGITNKLLAKKVNLICVAYEGMAKFFPSDKIVVTGNPVRKDIRNVSERVQYGYEFFGFRDQRKTIFVMGGSLGARTINLAMYAHLQKIIDERIQLIWQIGKIYFDDYQQKLKGYDLSHVRCYDFLKEMDLAYAVADVVISRAGALSISELCMVGKPVVFVPSPNVAEDHQTKNAQALVDQDAALMVKDSEAIDRMIPEAIGLLKNANRSRVLGENIRKLGIPDATERILNEIETLLN
jgi:UDP-N-acetylglucosamine--N-acetylmuramyl-(pentapeptide) pyrophosphoryl-undecaprenol N-acetylglucosamine transferase